MTATVDIEDLGTTKSEKLLAFVMLVFLLIGGIWGYQEIDDRVRASIELAEPTAEEAAAIRRGNDARRRIFSANRSHSQARQDVTFRREEFRAAIDAGRPRAALERQYRAAQASFAAAQAERRAAQRELEAALPAADAAQRRVSSRIDDRRDRQELVTFLLRLALVLGVAHRRLSRPRAAAEPQLALPPVGRSNTRLRDDPRLRARGRLPHRLLQSAGHRAPAAVADRRARHARRVLGAAALPRAAVAVPACPPKPVSLLRLPGAGERALRGLRPGGRCGVRPL